MAISGASSAGASAATAKRQPRIPAPGAPPSSLGNSRDSGQPSATIPANSSATQPPRGATCAGPGRSNVAFSQSTDSRSAVTLHSTLICSTPGANTARRAVPRLKSPWVSPASAPGPALRRSTRTASSVSPASQAPTIISRLRG